MEPDGRPPAETAQNGGTLLAVFAKYWVPGEVKTRLAAALGHERAAELHRRFVAATLARLAGVADSLWLAGTPDGSLPMFRQLPTVEQYGWKVVGQEQGDLGHRLKHLFRTAMATGFDRTVVVGSDSPDLPIERVRQAFERLAEVPVVIGPSADGGYYLIGAARRVPPIFDDMPWSSASLLSSTTRRLTAEGVPFAMLETWRDVDDISDLMALDDRLVQPAALLDPSLVELRGAISGGVRSSATFGARA